LVSVSSRAFLHRDHRLRGKVLHQRDLFVGKRPYFSAIKQIDPRRAPSFAGGFRDPSALRRFQPKHGDAKPKTGAHRRPPCRRCAAGALPQEARIGAIAVSPRSDRFAEYIDQFRRKSAPWRPRKPSRRRRTSSAPNAAPHKIIALSSIAFEHRGEFAGRRIDHPQHLGGRLLAGPAPRPARPGLGQAPRSKSATVRVGAAGLRLAIRVCLQSRSAFPVSRSICLSTLKKPKFRVGLSGAHAGGRWIALLRGKMTNLIVLFRFSMVGLILPLLCNRTYWRKRAEFRRQAGIRPLLL